MTQQDIYFAIDKDGSLHMFVEDPIRKEDHWTGKFYVNSVIYAQLKEAINSANLNWESDSQCIQITINDD